MGDHHLGDDIFSVILLKRQPFPDSLSHFAKASVIFWFRSIILLRQSFCYIELTHFAIVNSAILLQYSVILRLL
jgi:hypothetical protein